MRKLLFAAALATSAVLAAPTIDSASFGQPPPPGSIKGLAQVLAYAPQSVRDIYADAGFPFTTVGPYVSFKVRAWYHPDSGTVGFPRMPEGVVVLRIRKAQQSGCDSPLCVDDGDGLDPIEEAQFDCACTSGAQCFVPNPDGGVFPDGGPRPVPAPQGLTFPPPFVGSGCVRKACVQLFRDDAPSWPAECPCPIAGGC